MADTLISVSLVSLAALLVAGCGSAGVLGGDPGAALSGGPQSGPFSEE